MPNDENYDDRMIYRMLDNSGKDPVGDGFYLHDAIDFVENTEQHYCMHAW